MLLSHIKEFKFNLVSVTVILTSVNMSPFNPFEPLYSPLVFFLRLPHSRLRRRIICLLFSIQDEPAHLIKSAQITR